MDVIIFAVVAVVLFYRLYTVLGRKEDDPLPENVIPLRTLKTEPTKTQDPLDKALRRYHIPLFLKSVFASIISKDPSFDFHDFLEGAEEAYRFILIHALQRNFDPILPYISDTARIKLTSLSPMEKVDLEIQDIIIVGAELQGVHAFITVQFKSVINGSRSKELMEDWVFSRRLNDETPTWILNDIISFSAA